MGVASSRPDPVGVLMFPQTIVVPLDGSDFAEKAVPVAAAIVRRHGGDLLLMTTHWDGDVAGPRKYLEELVGTMPDLEVETVVVHDRPAAEAIDVMASDASGRTVCMTSHGRGRLRWAVLGSVAEAVVRTARQPVLLLGRHCATEWPTESRRLLVCVDGGSADPPVLSPAIEWAQALDLDVVVATAIHPLDRNAPDDVLTAITDRIEAAGRRVYRDVVRSSYPAGALADLAVEHDISVVAMSTHARTGAARLALGSVTTGVVGLAPCPVLVTRAS